MWDTTKKKKKVNVAGQGGRGDCFRPKRPNTTSYNAKLDWILVRKKMKTSVEPLEKSENGPDRR